MQNPEQSTGNSVVAKRRSAFTPINFSIVKEDGSDRAGKVPLALAKEGIVNSKYNVHTAISEQSNIYIKPAQYSLGFVQHFRSASQAKPVPNAGVIKSTVIYDAAPVREYVMESASTVLSSAEVKPPRLKKSWKDYSVSQQSGILRNDPDFRAWLGDLIGHRLPDAESAAVEIREKCGVKSMSGPSLHEHPESIELWRRLVAAFRSHQRGEADNNDIYGIDSDLFSTAVSLESNSSEPTPKKAIFAEDIDVELNIIDLAASNELEAVRELLAKGVNPNVQDEWGNTALYKAAFMINVDMIVVLLDGGADPNLSNERGETPLMLAARGWPSNSKAANLLVAAGANPNATDIKGWTALHIVAAYSCEWTKMPDDDWDGGVEMVKVLLSLGCCPSVRDNKFLSPADKAWVGFDRFGSSASEKCGRILTEAQRGKQPAKRPASK